MAELVSIKRNVDVSPGQAAPAVFHCSQGDVGSKIILGLLNNGTAYAIPSGVTVTIEGSESNGSIFTPISATASGSDITFYLTGEMTAVAGPAICQAVLKSGSNILGTANFTLEVESSPMGADAPPVFTDAGWTWMLNKLTTEFVPALGDNIIDAIDSKLDKNQGTANAGKYLKVGADGNVETADLDVTTDKTLSIANKAADAKAVGDEITNLKADLSENVGDLKSAILNDRKSLNGVEDSFVLMDLTHYPFLGYHLENGYWSVSTDYKCVLVPVFDIGDQVKFVATAYKCSYAFLKSDTIEVGEEPDLCDGESIETIAIGGSAIVTVPSDCAYMYVYVAKNWQSNFSVYSHLYAASVNVLKTIVDGMVVDTAEGYITKTYPNYEVLSDCYTSDAGNLTENELYNTYVYRADRDMEIYFANESQTATYISLVGYSSPNYDSYHRLFTRKRYTTNENTLPQANSKLSVSEGNYLAVSILKTENFNMYGFKLVTKLSNDISFNTSHIGKITEIANASSGRGFVQYQAESTAEASAEQLAVYIPSGNNYIKYRFVHTVYAGRNADVWRMGIADVVDGNFQTIMPLTNGSEWECALKISGRSDFSGGYSHGDEIGTSLLVFVDGKLTTYNSIMTMTPFSELKLVTYSNLYDPVDGTTLIATHGCERIFKDGALYFNQVINWKQNETLAECYLAMFGPRKTTNNNIAITTDYYTDAKYDDETIPSPVARSVSGVTDVTMFANSGFMGSVRVIEYPKKELLVGGGGIIISDNGGQNYNKLYFPVCTSGNVNIGDVWKSRSVYRMDYTVN